MRKLRQYVMLCGGSLLLAGLLTSCAGKPAAPAAGSSVVFTLFDVSGSTNASQIRGYYYHDFLDIVHDLRDGDSIMGDVITDDTLATSTYPIRETLPHYDMWRFSRLTFEEAQRRAERELLAQAEKVILHSKAAPRTDLMNSFEVAAKIFNGEQCRVCSQKDLIIFSDMVEQSHHYDFTGINLSDARIAAIIADERAGGRLPQLSGVKVWIAGAALKPSAGLDPQKIYQIQTFWLRYLHACGADIDETRYATRLINFRLH